MNYIDKETYEKIGLQYIFNKLNIITPFGKEKLKTLKPYCVGSEKDLIEELNTLEELIIIVKNNKELLKEIKNILNHIKDIRVSINRAQEKIVLSELELFEIKCFLLYIYEIKILCDKLNEKLNYSMQLNPIMKLQKLLDPEDNKIKTFFIYDNYSIELKNIRSNKRLIEANINTEKNNLIKKIKNELNLDIKSNGEITVSKNDEKLIETIKNYNYFEYSSENYMYVKYKIKKSNTINNLNKDLQEIKLKEENEEYAVRKMLSEKIADYSEALLYNIDAIGNLDYCLSKAYFSIEYKLIKPEINLGNDISIINGRHLEVEDNLKKANKTYTPIDIELKNGVTLITGANMGGKTITLKLIALLCSMTQYAFFVPATKMNTCLLNFIFISIGDAQSSDEGLSTFGGEIKKIKTAINKSDNSGLILIDELGSGTNPQEGHALSKAIINYLAKKRSISVVTTHYDNITNNDNVVHLQVLGLKNIDYKKLKNELCDNEINIDLISKHMDYRLIKITTKEEIPKDAINIARLMGLNEEILIQAEEYL